jgi:ribosomal protein L34E
MCFRKYMKQIQTGNKNSYWRGGRSQSHYERIRKEIKEQKCQSCGRKDCRLDTHHLDRDKSNNTSENIAVLCASCHAFLHYVEDNRGLNGWNMGKQQELRDRQRYTI